MGDLDSTDIAQEVHLQVLRLGDALREEGVLRWRHPFPLSDVLQGCYIDDGLIVGIVRKLDKFKPGRDSILCGRALDSLKKANPDIADEKGFGAAQPAESARRQTKYGAETLTTWGITVEGDPG